jgi:hypothetical protein
MTRNPEAGKAMHLGERASDDDVGLALKCVGVMKVSPEVHMRLSAGRWRAAREAIASIACESPVPSDYSDS